MNKNLLNRSFILGIYLSSSIFLSSCQDDDSGNTVTTPKGAYESGVLVVNEGNFQKGNGEISFINKQNKTVVDAVFLTENNRPLGDVVQSVTVNNDKAYVVVNNSNKIEIADANTFKSLGVINNLQLPRYMVVANNKGYVTEWVSFSGNGRVAVIDLATNAVTKTIAVGVLPEKLVTLNNKIYVVNSGENTVSVINPTSDAVEATVTVAASPNSLMIDANKKLWVLCGGAQNTPGSLVRVNPATNTIEATLAFTSSTSSPTDLVANGAGNKMYYQYGGKVYQQDITATTLTATPFINRSFYGIGVDPADNLIYGGDAGGFSAAGKVVRFNPSGAALDSFTVSIGPSEFVFK